MTARRAAIFPFELCRSILRGLRTQLKRDGMWEPGTIGLHHQGEIESEVAYAGLCQQCDDAQLYPMGADGEQRYFDDLTQQLLPTDLVKAGRKKELDYFHDKEVWVKVPIE